jgi:hypothetical protein
MSRSGPPISPEVRALLDREAQVPALAAQVRARSLARARAALIAGPAAPSTNLSAPRPFARWAVGIAVASIASAAVGITAYEMGSRHAPAASVAPPVTQPPAVLTLAPAQSATTPVVPIAPPPTSSSAVTSHPSRPGAPVPGEDELRLLREARVAVAGKDFTAALAAIGEHARRFKGSRLSEEREALRVKSLSGLGRTAEARRAADGFEARYPRSVLLPTVRRMPADGP